jgi:diguanylate cyclase (GGDEF)-like protein
VWSLALLYAGGASVAFATAAFPVDPAAQRGLLAATGVKALLIALLIYLLGARIPMWGIHVVLSTSLISLAVLVAHALTLAGAVHAAFVYLCIVLYAAHFIGHRSALFYAVSGSASYGIGLSTSQLRGALSSWLLVTVLLLTLALVISNLVGRLERQASVDPLTGALNRTGLFDAAANIVRIAARSAMPVSVVMLDLDEFKAINDGFGHAEGDRVLKAVADSWRALLRPTDRLARIGGDEFVVLLPGLTAAEARLVAERLVAGVDVSCSAGVGERRRDDDVDQLLARADADMYEIKSRRRRVA